MATGSHFPHLLICIFLFYNVESTPGSSFPDAQLLKCPGLYCGRVDEGGGNFSMCGACPRGSRPDESSICLPCEGEPVFYDWLYLGFMALLSPILHWFFIDFTNKKKCARMVILHVSAFVESVAAALCTLLVLEPRGSLRVTSCPVNHLSDWYTMFYNPHPGHTTTLHCTQEVVYPLYTEVIIYYAFGLVFMMLFRPWLSAQFVNYKGTKSIYAALYFFPILVVIQAVLAGVLYYFFPYITMFVSVVSSATHFAFFEEQSRKYLLMQTVTNVRRLMILIAHWLLHAYSIVAITQMRNPILDGPLILLVPFPALFYFITVQFTDPDNLEPL